MIEFGMRARKLPAPPQIVWESLANPHQPGARPWLVLRDDEVVPQILETEKPDRVREVVALVGEGLNNDEIAARLFMSPATAKTHVSRAMVKMHARDRAQLVVIAYESGLVRPGWS